MYGRRLWAMAGAVLLAVIPVTAPGPAQGAGYTTISGAGSSWSGPAMTQWAGDVRKFGMTVNYSGQGSSDGRNRFKAGTVDFAVSEIPYNLTDGGVVDLPPRQSFAYMPIVAGGTAFMYNLKIGDRQVTNLRLSGATLAKIFTGVITNWSDPAIKADNPRLALPARKIVPVVRSDGSGTSAQFTMWMAAQHQGVWDAYCRRAGRSTPCGFTSNYPIVPGLGFTAQSGSVQVAGYVANRDNIGTITYVEYSYARNQGFPVAKVLNQSGFYIEPTSDSVAVALTKAKIKPVVLTQDLSGVYTDDDDRSYPLSSYSYMIVPTREVVGKFSLDKGRTLAAFAYYFLCEGQQKATVMGFSPLPDNLVKAAKIQVDQIPGAVPKNIDGRSCNNPTLSADGGNALAQRAAYPKACDKAGADQCATGTAGNIRDTPLTGRGPLTGTGTGSGSTGTGSGTGTGTGGTGSGNVPGGTGAGATPGPGGDQGTGTGTGTGEEAVSTTVSLAAQERTSRQGFLLLAAFLLIMIVLAPPLLARTLRRRSIR